MNATIIHWENNINFTYKSTDDLAKHDVLAVQPASSGKQDEELRPVGIKALVGHRHPAW